MRPPKENIVIYNYKSNYESKRSSRTVGVESGDGAKDRRAGVAETQDGVDKEGNAEGRLTRRMGMKDEALKLADSYEVKANFISEHHEKSGKLRMSTTNQTTIKRHKKTADIIRRLVAELDKQWHMVNKDGYVKPLSEETIEELREYHGINDWLYETSIVDFVRAVEKAHGIQ